MNGEERALTEGEKNGTSLYLSRVFERIPYMIKHRSRETSCRCIHRVIDDVVALAWKCVKGLSRGKIYVLCGLYRARGESKLVRVCPQFSRRNHRARNMRFILACRSARCRALCVERVSPNAPILTCIKFGQLVRKITNYCFIAKHTKDIILLYDVRDNNDYRYYFIRKCITLLEWIIYRRGGRKNSVYDIKYDIEPDIHFSHTFA